jgi:sulfate/thiosulfate transport system ATP-binding protein
MLSTLLKNRPATSSELPYEGIRSELNGVPIAFSVQNLTKRFGKFAVLDNLSVTAPEGTLLALLGPPGSGKSTLLRIIAGLEQADVGSVRNSSEEVTYRLAHDRPVGFVFQQHALFRHLTVFENLAFALRARRWRTAAIEARVCELLQLAGLEGLSQSLPSQLSGAQQRRAAIGAALAAQPQLLLLDEPFEALDAPARRELLRWLRRLHDQLGLSTILATRNYEEALEVADRVAVIGNGRIQQIAAPHEIRENPANAFVVNFLGHINVFRGQVQSGKALIGDLSLDLPEYRDGVSRPAQLFVRPDELEIDREPLIGGCGLTATVVNVYSIGDGIRLTLEVHGHGLDISVDVPLERWTRLQLQRGDAVYVSPRRADVQVLDYQI